MYNFVEVSQQRPKLHLKSRKKKKRNSTQGDRKSREERRRLRQLTFFQGQKTLIKKTR